MRRLIRLWHKADISIVRNHEPCLLSGVTRTFRPSLAVSANDPKRTCGVEVFRNAI
jgi:hypothetical protein